MRSSWTIDASNSLCQGGHSPRINDIDDHHNPEPDESFVAYPRTISGWTPKEVDRHTMALVPWTALSGVGFVVVMVTGRPESAPLAIAAGIFFFVRGLLGVTQLQRWRRYRVWAKAFALASLISPVLIAAVGLGVVHSIATTMLAVPFIVDAVAAKWALNAMRRADQMDDVNVGF